MKSVEFEVELWVIKLLMTCVDASIASTRRSRAFTLPAILIEFSRTLSEWRGLKGNFLELQTEANSDKRARVFDIMLNIGRVFTFRMTNIAIINESLWVWVFNLYNFDLLCFFHVNELITVLVVSNVWNIKSTVYNNVFLQVHELVYAITVDQKLNFY